jgi:predicted transcriptional regulator
MDLKDIKSLVIPHVVTCVECERKFDMTKEHDVTEWSFGHDCESL